MASFRASQNQERRGRRGLMTLASVSLLAVLVCGPFEAACRAWVPSTGTQASQPSRREAAAAAVAAALFGGSLMPEAAHAGEFNQDVTDNPFEQQDSPELVARRKEETERDEKRMELFYNDFREQFATFAADETPIPQKVEILDALNKRTLAEKMLPRTISRDDVVKGVRAIKFNSGCTKAAVKEGDCKKFEKAYMRLLAAIDKVNDKNIITR
eukprot:TRINITY_DN48695_c0_g1_i1.p1 TRINITY_DN48695_c0_g1~~TRINITY_DN48695_c0_g1_i1.p1  ORF type:complete len:213 (-),score=42.76 TRINITY_DN48695_c0_g1_i1:207-845(-)